MIASYHGRNMITDYNHIHSMGNTLPFNEWTRINKGDLIEIIYDLRHPNDWNMPLAQYKQMDRKHSIMCGLAYTDQTWAESSLPQRVFIAICAPFLYLFVALLIVTIISLPLDVV